jgi:hypothetical protein
VDPHKPGMLPTPGRGADGPRGSQTRPLEAACRVATVNNEELCAVGDDLASEVNTHKRPGQQERFRSIEENGEGNG